MNVMYFSYQPYFLHFAEVMAKKDWVPVYWSVVPNVEGEIKAKYPHAICHNHFDAIKGIPPKEYQGKDLNPLCPSVLSRLANHERIVLGMFERNDSHTSSFSYRERVSLYQYLVQYWLTVLEDLSPQYVVFEEEPHQANDYVLYAVCQLLDINTIMFIQTRIDKLLYPINKFEEGSKAIYSSYRDQLASGGADKVILSERMEKYFSDLQGSFDQAVFLHLYDQVDEVIDLMSNRSMMFVAMKKTARFIIKKLNIKELRHHWRLLVSKPGTFFYSDQKQRNKTFKASRLTYVEHLYYKSKTLLKKNLLKRYYKAIAQKSYELNRPYVFCPLHYQPEKTTCPLGGIFDDQLYMISLLSQALPEGWLLYVKDHPSQFVSSYTRYGEHYRSKEYYNEIVKMPKVRLMPLSTNTYELIDNSKAVVSVTSTSGWEAVIRGVPAIMFGHCWFRFCKGVFYASTLEDIKKVFGEILNGYQINENETRLFLKVMEENTFEGVVGGPGVQKFFDISDEENGLVHAQAVKSLLKSHRTTN